VFPGEPLVLVLQDGSQPGTIDGHAAEDLSNSGATLGL
jgi:hypothetical protein